MLKKKIRLGDYLIETGKITEKELKIALEIQKKTKRKLGEILIELGFITFLDLLDYLAKVDVDKLKETFYVSTKLDVETLKKLKTIVINETKDKLFIATLNPSLAKETLRKITRKEIEVVKFDVSYILERLKSMKSEKELKITSPNELLSFILKEAVLEKASDIHISYALSTATIMFRIDGVRVPKYFIDEKTYEKLVAYIKQKTRTMDISKRHLPQDGTFVENVFGKLIDIRVSTVPTVLRTKNNLIAENVVMRILDRESVIVPLEEIGLRKKDLENWKKLITSKDGIVLVCGATGSGKTTTIYSSLLYLDRIGKHIATVENPVEYKFPFITQVNVRHEIGLDFKSVLKAFLRQDPDVILVGEVRDEETARIMVQAGETGHLVFATLHANSILVVLDRLKELGFSFGDIKYLLKGILVQTLLRKVCQICKGQGCKYCNYTGYKGRVLAYEFLRLSPKIVDTLVYMKEKGLSEKEIAKKLNYVPIREYAKMLVKEKITSIDEYKRVFGG